MSVFFINTAIVGWPSRQPAGEMTMRYWMWELYYYLIIYLFFFLYDFSCAEPHRTWLLWQMCYFSNTEQNRTKRRMHGTLLLSDPGGSVPKFVDDLFRVVQRQNKAKLGFHFYLCDTMLSQFASQVGCWPYGLNEGLALLSSPVFSFCVQNVTIVMNFSGLIICQLKI